MEKALLVGAVLFFGVSASLTVGARRAAAQGPAGQGASAAAQDSSRGSFSPNPITWLKKDSKNSASAPGSRSDVEKKLTPNLQGEGILGADTTVTDACAPFTALEGCLAALHASHNLGVDFHCLRAEVTGVNSNVDLSGCKVADGEKAQGLGKSIHQLKPEANAKQAAKDAEQQANDDLKKVGE
jgi:hypothetical protein